MGQKLKAMKTIWLGWPNERNEKDPNQAGSERWEHVPTMFPMKALNTHVRKNQTWSSFDWLLLPSKKKSWKQQIFH